MARWWRFQQTMNKKRWLELDRERNGPISLWDFSRSFDALDAAWVHETSKKGGWRISDDSMVIGGYSSSSFELIQTPQDYQQVLQGRPSISMKMYNDDNNRVDFNNLSSEDEERQDVHQGRTELDSDSSSIQEEQDEFIPFVRWKGVLDTRVNNNNSNDNTRENDHSQKVLRSGFCAIRSPEYPFGGANLGGRYNGLEITCRSDGRPYSVNLRCESFIHDDIFQCFINIPPTIQVDNTNNNNLVDDVTGGRFDKVVLLFQHFIATSGGRMRVNQRQLDNSVKIQSIGFTLMDGVDGPFQFDLARIRAVNYDETGVVGHVD